jgi:hypothetical protein
MLLFFIGKRVRWISIKEEKGQIHRSGAYQLLGDGELFCIVGGVYLALSLPIVFRSQSATGVEMRHEVGRAHSVLRTGNDKRR